MSCYRIKITQFSHKGKQGVQQEGKRTSLHRAFIKKCADGKLKSFACTVGHQTSLLFSLLKLILISMYMFISLLSATCSEYLLSFIKCYMSEQNVKRRENLIKEC